jgi:site-specific DNA recombinase
MDTLERVVVARDRLLVTIAGAAGGDSISHEIRVAWSTKAKDAAAGAVEDGNAPEVARDDSLIQSIVRAHAWVNCFQEGAYASIEQLAEAHRLHPKVVRQALRVAFLSPDVTSAILKGRQPCGLSLARIPKLLPLLWAEHRRLLG